MINNQDPNFNNQTIPNKQITITKTTPFEYWKLDVEICLFLGYW